MKENLTLQLEPEIIEAASSLFRSLGLDISTATEIFYREAIRCNGFPFKEKIDEPNASTEHDDDIFGPFDSIEELMEALNS